MDTGYTLNDFLCFPAGCDIDTLDEELLTPLDRAVEHDLRDIITLLLKAGCRVEKSYGHVYYREHYCNSLLYSLASQGDVENVKLLVQCTDINRTVLKASKIFNVLRKIHSGIDPVLDLLQGAMTQPRSLRNCCRLTIRDTLTQTRYSHRPISLHTMVSRLNLPKALMAYLCCE